MFKGKAQPVVVYEMLSRMDEADEKQKRSCTIFADALRDFKRQAWDEAKEKFHRAIENCETDRPAHFYINLCEQYKKNPPEGLWEGAIPLDEK
jgi:adenylate cyclase